MKPEEMVGRRVAEIRERLGMTQQQLGEALGPLLGKPWPRQTVSSAEKGKRSFTAAELVALAIVLRTQANRLLLAPMELEQLEMPGGEFVGRNALSAVLGYRGGDTNERFHAIAATGRAVQAIRDAASLTSARIQADQQQLARLKVLYEDLAEREFPEDEQEGKERDA
jgi:transcriptional regulator with XRE-family HTH domain